MRTYDLTAKRFAAPNEYWSCIDFVSNTYVSSTVPYEMYAYNTQYSQQKDTVYNTEPKNGKADLKPRLGLYNNYAFEFNVIHATFGIRHAPSKKKKKNSDTHSEQ